MSSWFKSCAWLLAPGSWLQLLHAACQATHVPVIADGFSTRRAGRNGTVTNDRATLLLILATVVVLPSVAAESVGHGETVSELAVRRLANGSSAVVANCAAQVPSMKKSLDRAMSRRRSRITSIAKVLLADVRFDSVARAKVPTDVIAFYAHVDREASSYLYSSPRTKLDCNGVLKDLRNTPARKLSSQLEAAISEIQEMIAGSTSGLQ